MNKKLALCAVLLAATTSIAHLPQTHAASAPGMVQFVINKTTYTNHTGQHTLSAAPFEQQGNTMVPLRAVADSLGASIKWDEATQSATLSGQSFGKIRLIVNSSIAFNAKGEKIKLPATVKVVRGTLFVPVRSVSELMGAQVNWTASTRTITITSDRNTIQIGYNFNKSEEGWKAGFADLPVDYNPDIYELGYGREILPVGKDNKTNYGLKLKGHNRSDDLFMFLSRKVDGFVPNTIYQVKMSFAMYTKEKEGSLGIGGSPASAVIVKAGILNKEPVPIVVSDGGSRYYRMNIDKGNQSAGGSDVKKLGNIAKPDSSQDGYQRVNMEYNAKVKANAKGELFLLIGVDSGFEGLTTLYFDDVNVTAKRQ
ncbi:copper amine oxidase N-terminal domain-containing protein [Paenibacillus pinihumi]|uniref:copper amine oxidase N-terminal domain-containing protein n=1 Tax=Paenibacillus pinihumi TaxID=669462 RepID=UPI000686E7E9|nr:copper amine oxidase N-terminal domain-containing protein [Paenibacillus pinihumi]